MSGELAMWTVYDHPTDFPEVFVARMCLVGAGVVQHTEHIITSKDLEEIRDELSDRGLVPTQPMPGDDPVILEVWL